MNGRAQNSPAAGDLQPTTLGAFMRSIRIERGYTKTQVAAAVIVSISAYEKWEADDRAPRGRNLAAWCNALDVNPWQLRKILSLASEGLYRIDTGSWPREVTAVDMEHLESFPFPAMYRTVPEYDIVAVNETARRLFPCYAPAQVTAPRPVNALEAMLLDPGARDIFENWESMTHQLVYMLKTLAPGISPPERLMQIIDACSEAPEFDRFWNTDPPSFDDDEVVMREPRHGAHQTYTMRCYEPDFPSRPYQLVTMTPRR